MENNFCEVVSLFHAPSADARLVLFADDEIHTGRLELHKHLELCSEYAIAHKVYLVSGLLVHNQNLCLCLFSPAGQLVCRQAAVQLSMALYGKLSRADVLQVVHTEIGNLALCVDVDIFHPQISRAAALKGADILISVQHLDPVDDTSERLVCSVWNAAQTNNIYVINLAGSACTVSCPAALTRAKDGYLVRRTSLVPTRFGLNLDRLDQVRAQFPLLEKINGNLVREHAAQLKGW